MRRPQIGRAGAIAICSLLWVLGGGDIPKPPLNAAGPPVSPELPSEPRLREIARQIAVRVYSGRVWGTGILIGERDGIYTVVTNDHVLLPGGGQNYRVETPDGRTHAAEMLRSVSWGGNDLGVVRFPSPDRPYTVAAIAQTPATLGETVIAAGFPLEADRSRNRGFIITEGTISRWMERPFVGGYQLGYTNDIFSGMSGGPLLNDRGEVVGVNGMHKYPLWGSYRFADGSSPPETVAAQLVRYSWAVPIQTVLQLAPEWISGGGGPRPEVADTPAPPPPQRLW